MSALERRHLANLRVAEVTRALRALSSSYVERRGQLHASLDTAGKRAAFALFYGPLHFLTVSSVVQELGAGIAAGARIVDLGCGTGAAGAAMALCSGPKVEVLGLDRHPWAVAEAAWTYRHLQLPGRARLARAQELRRLRPRDAVVAGWVLNELAAAERQAVEEELLRAAERGTRILIVEPIARGVAPWWNDLAARASARGGAVREWRIAPALPPLVALLDKAAGLDHRVLTARTLYLPGSDR
jgi:hypothetical protein